MTHTQKKRGSIESGVYVYHVFDVCIHHISLRLTCTRETHVRTYNSHMRLFSLHPMQTLGRFSHLLYYPTKTFVSMVKFENF